MENESAKNQRELSLQGKLVSFEVTKLAGSGSGYHSQTYDEEFSGLFTVGATADLSKSTLRREIFSYVQKGEVVPPQTCLTMEQVQELSKRSLKNHPPGDDYIVEYDFIQF